LSAKRLTMADIGRLAGVSASTVSRALSGDPTVAQKTAARVREIAAEHDYVLNERARNFRLKITQTVALVFPSPGTSRRMISDPFYMELLGAIAEELDSHGYDLIIARVPADDPAWSDKFVKNRRVDGLITVDRLIADAGLERLRELDTPVVIWGPEVAGQSYLSVGGDSRSGATMAVRHLASRGRRRIGFVGGNRDMVETAERYRGYQQGLDELGLPFNEDLVVFTDFSQQESSRAAGELLERAPDVDGLFVCSDFMAVAVMEVLKAHGRDVPRDVSVVGYDDIQLAAHCSPRLTTIRQQIDAGGRLLARKVLALVRGEPVSSAMLPIQLVVRDSS